MALHSIRKDRLSKVPLAAVFVIVAVMVALVAGGLYAKYATTKTSDSTTGSAAFYFNSDQLSAAGTSHELSADTTNLTITLRNSADDLRWADCDIQYAYEVTKDGSAFASGTGTISRSASTASTSKFTVKGMTAGTYVVTARATAPYASQLSGTFTVPAADEGLTVKVGDTAGSAYAMLRVGTGAKGGKVKVSWPAGVCPDTTQTEFAQVKTYANGSYSAGSVEISLDAYSSVAYRFIKMDSSKDYSDGADITAARVG